MADSTFWRNLVARFLVLKSAMQIDSWIQLKAVWTSDQSVTPPLEHWELQSNDTGFRLMFEPIARDGGDALSPNDFVDSLYTWINALARESSATGIGTQRVDNGFELDNLVEASIRLCSIMESEMLGAERHQRHIAARSSPQSAAIPPAVPVAPPQPAQPETQQLSPVTPANDRVPARRRPSMIFSPPAVRRIDAYLDSHPHLNITQFVGNAHISDRTLRSIRRTSRARRDTWQGIAGAIGITLEALLQE